MIYKNEYLNEISFPLGGIGTGCIGISGNGMFTDWEIENHPDKGNINGPTCFSVVCEKPNGERIVKVLHGDLNKNLSGEYTEKRYRGFGSGPYNNTMCGFPHFGQVVFDGRFPIATLTFSDEKFPGIITLNAWSPFIPLDSKNSSIPCALFDIKITDDDKNNKYYVYFTCKNFFDHTLDEDVSNEKYAAVKLSNAFTEKDDLEYGDITIASDLNDTVQEYAYRGSARDSISVFWNELEKGNLKPRHYPEPYRADMCTIGGELKDGKGKFVLSWNIPNRCNYWDPLKDENEKDITWKNYYAVLFRDSVESAFYSLDNYDKFFTETSKFRDSIFSSSLPEEVLDAISSNLSVLRSPTVMRLENGEFYGFEGCNQKTGSCEGTCTHVYNYAYAVCFLFPDLERNLRETEFKYDVAENGRMRFRTLLPLGRTDGRKPQCLDGSMLTIFKTYREWKISGDDDFLKRNFETLKKIISYNWSEENYNRFDYDHDGILEGRQHNTLDADLFGPSSWLEGLYLLALKCMSLISEYLGYDDLKSEYDSLFANGYEFMKTHLFNGEYFIQELDVSDKEYALKYDGESYFSDETNEIKYQIGEGSEIDQMLAQWHSNIMGLGDIYDPNQKKTALNSMMKYNFKESMRDFVNMWRVYALNDEGGSIICAYPEGKRRPIIPIQYCDECMTGFEYAFAGLLISEGFIDDGLKVVKAVRSRYDGKKRNPYNEIECGSNYARSMASFALMNIYGGFTFDLPDGTLGFAPVLNGDFKMMWSLGTGWGDYIKTEHSSDIVINYGYLNLKKVKIPNASSVKKVTCDGKEIPFSIHGDYVIFNKTEIREKLSFIYGI